VVRVAVRAEATAEEVSVAAMPAELPASFHPVCQSACKVRGVAGRFRERMILLVKKTVDRNTVSKFAAVCCPVPVFGRTRVQSGPQVLVFR
jgi:hypothetical protein